MVGRKFIDLTGRTFGSWFIIERAKDRKGQTYWLCKCQCGNKREVNSASLRKGLSSSCGCLKYNDLTGQRFNNWTVLRRANTRNKDIYWLCRCRCGTEREVTSQSLRLGKTKGCGCQRYDVDMMEILKLLRFS